MGALLSPYLTYLKQGYVESFGSRFSGMVFIGDELTVGGQVVGSETLKEGLLYTFEVCAKRGEDIVASREAGFFVSGD